MEFTTLSTKDKTLTGQITTTDKIENICGVECWEKEGIGRIRTVSIDGNIYFVGKDVAEILGYSNPQDAIRNHVEEEDKKMGEPDATPYVLDSLGRKQYPVYINESGLYSLTLSSKIPKAKKFKHWVTSEVLPSIRKNGGYIANQEKLTPEQIVANALIVAHNIIAQKDKELEEKRKKLAILAHVNKTYTMTEIAKELNLKSATELNKLLADRKIQYKINGTWVFYSRFSDLGYEEIKQEVLDSGRVIYHRKITQLGREFILSLFDEVA